MNGEVALPRSSLRECVILREGNDRPPPIYIMMWAGPPLAERIQCSSLDPCLSGRQASLPLVVQDDKKQRSLRSQR